MKKIKEQKFKILNIKDIRLYIQFPDGELDTDVITIIGEGSWENICYHLKLNEQYGITVEYVDDGIDVYYNNKKCGHVYGFEVVPELN